MKHEASFIARALLVVGCGLFTACAGQSPGNGGAGTAGTTGTAGSAGTAGTTGGAGTTAAAGTTGNAGTPAPQVPRGRRVAPGRQVVLGRQVPAGRRVAPAGAAVRPAPQERPEGAVALPAVPGGTAAGAPPAEAEGPAAPAALQGPAGPRRPGVPLERVGYPRPSNGRRRVRSLSRHPGGFRSRTSAVSSTTIKRIVYMSTVDSSGTYGGAIMTFTDWPQMATATQTPLPYGGRRADTDLFQAERHLGSHVPVGPVGFTYLTSTDPTNPHRLVGDRTSSLRRNLSRRQRSSATSTNLLSLFRV